MKKNLRIIACILALLWLVVLSAAPASAQYVVHFLVSNDTALNAQQLDSNLVNGWGLASFPNSPWWVSNQNTSTSTMYNGDGSIVPLVVQIPCVVSGTVTVPCPFPAEGLLFEPNNNLLNFFAPYGIQAIGNKLYVTYFSLVGSAGILDVCNLATGVTHPKCRRLFASLGPSPILASPFGMVRAPNRCGPLSNMLLVGNLDDGLIHAFNPDPGHLAGTLTLSSGSPFAVPGLWGLDFGSGIAPNGARNELFFSAGPCPPSPSCPAQEYGDGLFGEISFAGTNNSR